MDRHPKELLNVRIAVDLLYYTLFFYQSHSFETIAVFTPKIYQIIDINRPEPIISSTVNQIIVYKLVQFIRGNKE